MRSKHDIDKEDLRILDELITRARSMVAAHTGEQLKRRELRKNGKKPQSPWQVFPNVATGILSLVPRLLECRRATLSMPPLKRPATSASTGRRELPP
ncbi:MAG: hypothetical protein ACYTDT_06065 [Planctomycetota bacterium]|jgi:hypothetical protein